MRRSLRRVTCPHCWHSFLPEQVLWISQHAELLGDQVLGAEAPARFLPTRFTVDGQAIDARGMACHWLACPSCHLPIIRDMLESEPLFLSIIGIPSSGKSCYLAAMTWELRRVLPAKFNIAFADADTVSNRVLNSYEETLFLQAETDDVVAIRKTELQGELYDQIQLGQQIVSLPRPFLFLVRPPAQLSSNGKTRSTSRVMCLYDNAGEHFQPGMDSVASPVTQHLAKSRVLMFVYDPTQDMRFREKCRAFSQDPQLASSRRPQRQETILREAALRVRRYASLASNQRLDRPLLVLVAKSDMWGPLLPDVDMISEPIIERGGLSAIVDLRRVESVSGKIRELLKSLAPEFVAAAEEFCQHVIYVPVSALGGAPEVDAGSNVLGIRPRNVRPRWVTIPVLYTFAKWSTGLISARPRV